MTVVVQVIGEVVRFRRNVLNQRINVSAIETSVFVKIAVDGDVGQSKSCRVECKIGDVLFAKIDIDNFVRSWIDATEVV